MDLAFLWWRQSTRSLGSACELMKALASHRPLGMTMILFCSVIVEHTIASFLDDVSHSVPLKLPVSGIVSLGAPQPSLRDLDVYRSFPGTCFATCRAIVTRPCGAVFMSLRSKPL
jgi:hypothetical protein